MEQGIVGVLLLPWFSVCFSVSMQRSFYYTAQCAELLSTDVDRESGYRSAWRLPSTTQMGTQEHAPSVSAVPLLL